VDGFLNMRLIIAILFLCLTGCGQHWPVSTPFVSSPTLETDVIVSFLQKRYGSRLPADAQLVIGDTFSSDGHGQSPGELMSQASDRIPADLIRDFCDKNTKPGALWPEIGSRLHAKLISRAEVNAFFSAKPYQKPDGWDKFYSTYPHSPGIIAVSRVGFNRKGNIAMLYMGSSQHWLAGSGKIYVFRKRGGKWVEEPFSIGPIWFS
jgi:hypothetical protein